MQAVDSEFSRSIAEAKTAADDALALSRLQKVRVGEVTSCDLNANYLLAVGSSDKKVRILQWNAGLGFVDVCYSPLSFHKYAVTSVRFSPKGTILASASLDGTAVLIDVFKGTKIFTAVQEKKSNIRFCEFTFDCTKLITGAEDGTLCFWDLVRRRQIRHCRLHEDDRSLRGLAVTPDSEYLLSVDSGNLLKVWFVGDVFHHRPRCFSLKKDIHDDVLGCEFSPVKNITGGRSLKLDYRAATCGADGLAKIWAMSIERRERGEPNLDFACDLKLLHVLRHEGDVLSVRFDPGGNHIVSTGLNNVAKLWEVRTGICLGTLQGHARYVTSAVFSKDSLLLVTGSIDKTLIVWTLSKNLSLDSRLLTPCNASSHFTNVNATSYSAGNGPTDREKRYGEFAVLQKVAFASAVNSVCFRGDDDLAVGGGQGTVEIWKKERSERKYERHEALKEHECSVNHLDSPPSGSKIISCSAEGTLILWDLNTSLAYKMKSPSCTGSLRICKFSPDSRFIVAAGDDQKVSLWDANNLEFFKTVQEHENAVTAVAYTPDGKFLVAASGSEITLQDLEKNKFTAKMNNAHDLGVLCCDVSPVSIVEKGIDVNINSGQRLEESRGFSETYLLATGGNDSLVKLWKVSEADIFSSNVLSGHGGTVNCVQFSSAKPFLLASCSSDTTVRIWDTKSEYCLHVLNYHKSAVTTCSFSKDSTLLATGSLDKSVFILRLITRPYHEPREPEQNSNKLLENWTPSDVANWFLDIGRPEIAVKIQERQFSGRELWSIRDDSIADLFGLKNEKEQEELKIAFLKLKKFLGFPSDVPCKGRTIPHKFLCPITHQIMRDPVICTDGYTYDRTSITEWFLSGNLISPITKEFLITTKLLPYSALKINIHKFLHESQ